MKHRVIGRLTAAATLGLFMLPALAHHSDAGRYDENTVIVSGTVVALRFVNPHSSIVLDVEENGQTTRWQVEMGSPRNLAQTFGWTAQTLKPGDQITLTGRRAKTGAPFLNLTERAQIRRTDSGEELFRTANYGEDADEATPAAGY